MRKWFISFLLAFLAVPVVAQTGESSAQDTSPITSTTILSEKTAYVLPIRDDIMEPVLYVVRRGVKEAMEAEADLLIVDMETNGGRVDIMHDIIDAISRFEGETVTYVNKNAFSAGAMIAVATQKIFMAPESVIGAAAPVMMTPGGGAGEMPDTMQAKMESAVAALVRAQAQKNGHNSDVVEAMIMQGKELIIDDEIIAEKGEILTLTNREAEQEFGDPPTPLLSAGTIEDIDALLVQLGYDQARRVDIVPSGSERIASWINSIRGILLIIGIVGLYIEFKTPGFGLPGIVGILAFSVYFFGNYIAGISGMEWMAVFLLGVILVALELFVIPGTIIVGLLGAGMMFLALLMAMVPYYPGMPAVPAIPDIQNPLQDLGISLLIAFVIILILAKILPRTSIYARLVSQTASGMESVEASTAQDSSRIGREGITLSTLRPSGKAQFEDEILDVITQGDLIDRDRRVRITGFSGPSAVVEPID